MIDLSQSPAASPLSQTVPTDPDMSWVKDADVAVDAPPDSEVDPLPEAQWPADAARTGVCGSVCPRAVALPGGGYRLYYTQILPRPGFPAGANDVQVPFAPEVLRIVGGGYRMYYALYSAPNRASILSAVSDDALKWRKEAEPVISPGGVWDAAKCSEMCAIRLACREGQAPRYRMFYEACDGTAAGERGVWRIAGATSAGRHSAQIPSRT